MSEVAFIFDRRPRPRLRSSLGYFASLLAVCGLAACRDSAAAASKPQPPQQTVARSDIPEVLATLGDEKVTLQDIRARIGENLDRLEIQYQLTKSRMVRAALDSIVREKTLDVEAQRQKKSVDQLVAAEVGPAGFEPSPLEVETWYKDNLDRVGGRSLEQVRGQIADFLRTQRRHDAERKLEDRLKSERKVTVNYRPFRLQFDNGQAPSLGKSDAPVTLVEFSDFQCPYCQRTAPTLKELAKKFGSDVRIVYRQFPIPSLHPFALKAAEASLCANEQGKFWVLHDTMFADQTKLAVSDLKETARRVGLDSKKFNECLDSGRYVEQVQNDQREGQRVGITGTPAMFINGLPVEGGSVPYPVLEAAIQKELTAVKQPASR